MRYSDDSAPGITRVRSGTKFRYVGVDGKTIKDAAEVQRINSLAIPPAYEHVWICPHADGHIQATGRDARGRKQYRYHADWRVERDRSKFEHMIDFAHALPKIRTRVEKDLRGKSLSKSRVLATVVALLEATLIRVGNDGYARENASYGLTTLRNRHVELHSNSLRFVFRGKSGVQHDIQLTDRRLTKIIRALRDLPGQRLFEYLQDDGSIAEVHSDDVNTYLAEIAGGAFTAKDFRTWAGTVACAVALAEAESATTAADAKRRITMVIGTVAAQLGNTVAVCRKSYIHPAVPAHFLENHNFTALRIRAVKSAPSAGGLSAEEKAVLRFLQGAPPTGIVAEVRKSGGEDVSVPHRRSAR